MAKCASSPKSQNEIQEIVNYILYVTVLYLFGNFRGVSYIEYLNFPFDFRQTKPFYINLASQILNLIEFILHACL